MLSFCEKIQFINFGGISELVSQKLISYKKVCTNHMSSERERAGKHGGFPYYKQMTKLAFSYQRWESVHTQTPTPPCTRSYAFGIPPSEPTYFLDGTECKSYQMVPRSRERHQWVSEAVK